MMRIILLGSLLLLILPARAEDDAQIRHVLNRITFGPRPGDVEAVRQMGVQAYINQQLHPETIDDSAVENELRSFELLQMSSRELVFLTKRLLKKTQKLEAEGKLTYPKPAQETPAPAPATNSGMPEAPMMEAPPATVGEAAPMPTGEPAPAMKMTNAAGKGGWIGKMNARKSVAAIGQLEKAKLIRAVESPRQLQEVLVDFWTNHFNIDMKKGICRALKVADDRDVIRPHILGKFRDLLEASAKSPAMLFYLDNAQNSVPRTLTPLQQQLASLYLKNKLGNLSSFAPPPRKKMGGINENYAREIMELHTLGVDGGYTQKDVQEVARCFTGWGFNRLTGEFVFAPRLHDNGSKVVLGHVIPANGGMQDGETVLDILASSPATAHHIALELCQRFVGDEPPEPLVIRMAAVFQNTGGDLREVTSAILHSPEFLSPSDYRTKIKSPLEFAVSAVRATESSLMIQDPPPFDHVRPTMEGAAMEGAAVLGRGDLADRLSKAKRQSLNWHIYELGEPLFACTPPTGYKEVSKNWVSPGELIERLNFSLAFTQQKIADVRFDPKTVLNGADLDKPETVLNQCVNALLQGNISAATRQVLAQAALPAAGESKTVNPARLIALILGSPEFQRK